MAEIINGQEAADLVEGGGTGLATVTDHSVMVGSGTDPVTPIAVGTTGQILVGSTSADPVFTTITDVDTLLVGVAINGSSPPEAASILTSTYSVEVRNFDDAADEDLYFTWQVPKDFTGTTITFRVITWITNATGTSTSGVAFFLQGASIANGELISSALGTARKSSYLDTTHTQYDRVATTWSATAVTVTGIAAGETAMFKLYRDVSDGDDDYAQDIGVEALQIKYSKLLSS